MGDAGRLWALRTSATEKEVLLEHGTSARLSTTGKRRERR
jgi:hypothetical protein